MFINIQVHKLILPALVDSGAECGLIFRSELFYELQTQGGVRLTPQYGVVGVANGKTAEITGVCYPRVHIGGTT